MAYNPKYDDIIDRPHHVSHSHPRMPLSDRAFQFAPFAALSGYADTIRETQRLTERKIELDEGTIEMLNRRYRRLMDTLDSPSGSMMSIVVFSCSFMRNTSFLPLMANLSIAYKEDIS